jgi:hypothetical protein
MWRWSGHSKRPSFGSSIVSFMCDSIFFVHVFRSFVGWSSFFNFQSYVIERSARHQVPLRDPFGSRVTSPCRCQVQSHLSRSLRSIGASHLYVRHRSVYQTGLLLQQCIQPATSDVNIFAIYHYIFYHFQELLQCALLSHHVGGSYVGHKM